MHDLMPPQLSFLSGTYRSQASRNDSCSCVNDQMYRNSPREAVSCSPTVHAVLGTAAELQHLVPVMFNEVQNTADNLILCVSVLSEAVPVYMDM